MSRAIVAFLDAQVLFSRHLRVLLHLGNDFALVPRGSDAVHDEWTEAVVRRHPDIPRSRMLRTRAFVEAAFPRAHIPGPFPLEDAFAGVHPGDRHVAAAVAGSCTHLVTWNLRHFPAEALQPHGLVPVDPDTLVSALIDDDAVAIRAVLERHRLRHPPSAVRPGRRSGRARAGGPRPHGRTARLIVGGSAGRHCPRASGG